ncbi:MAG: DUF4157 domain-containing protein, partial [Verrucomicrobia bacterium]|nr:DUF4157 domain-containing protein [Verrucomicrobiota bacterium]
MRSPAPAPAGVARRVPGWSTLAGAVPFGLGRVQRQVKIGKAGDASEKEADRVSDQVLSGSTASQPVISRLETLQRCCCCGEEPMERRPSGQGSVFQDRPEERMQHRPSGQASVIQCKADSERESDGRVQMKGAGTALGTMQAAASRAISSKGRGQPMRPDVRTWLESRMGADLGKVRVHQDSGSFDAAAALNARAFTYRDDIWLGRGESPEDVRLMAHEATHVVQQGAAVQRSSTLPVRVEEKQQEPSVRRSIWDKVTGVAGAAWDATAGKLVDAAGNAIEMGADFFWKVIRTVAPGIVPIIEQIRAKGIKGYLGELLSGAFNRIFGGFSQGGGFIAGLITTFTTLLSSAREIIAALSHGDCQPLFNAVSRLGDLLSEAAGAAWDRIKEFFAPIGDFFSDLWRKFGAPAVDFLGQVASDIWEDIKALGRKIWDWTQPVRDALSAAWKWVKDQLGIGDEPEGQNGILQWVQRKLGEAWDEIKARLEPVIGPMRDLIVRIKAILPLDAILNLREKVHEWLGHAGDMVKGMQKPQGVTENQASLRDKILPAVKASIVGLRDKVLSAGSWVSGQIGAIATTVTGFFASLRSNVILGKLAGAIQWVQDKVTSLRDWVQGGVISLFNLAGNGVAKLADFVEPVLNVLKKVVSVIVNVVRELPGLVLGPVWKAIPACIREPIKQFIIEHILSAIPIISTFMKVPDVWEKIQKLVMDFLTQVFVKGDLSGAAMMVIRFVLEAAGINVDLFLNVLANAAGALDTIIMHPVEFLNNLWGALSKGMGRFLSNIGQHLINGLLGWILGPLEDLGVKPPKDLSLGSLLDLVLQILGITGARLREKVEKVVGPTAVRIIDEAWKWISALMRGGLAGLWEEIKTRLSDLWGMVIGGLSQWITVEIIEAGIGALTRLSNPVGAVIEALRTIYKTVTFIVGKINKILALANAIVNSIGKIATGMIDDAANWIENALARTVPLIINFFADWIGIGSPAPKIREIVTRIQAKVDAALDWLAEKAVGIGKSILGALGLGEKPEAEGGPDASLEWWNDTAVFSDTRGRSHKLFFSGQGASAALKVASDEMLTEDFVTKVDDCFA